MNLHWSQRGVKGGIVIALQVQVVVYHSDTELGFTMMGSKVSKVATFKYTKDAPERHVFAEIRGR